VCARNDGEHFHFTCLGMATVAPKELFVNSARFCLGTEFVRLLGL